jgi:hypothetical protein
MNGGLRFVCRILTGGMILASLFFYAPLKSQTNDPVDLLEEPTDVVPVEKLLEVPVDAGPTVVSTPSDMSIPLVAPGVTVGPTPSMSGGDGDDIKAPALPDLSVFPNPARGLKVTFRFQSPENFQYQISVYNRFGESTALLIGEGKDLVDVVWPLEQVPEGIYYYRVLAVHPLTGTVQKIPVGRLVVEKDPKPSRPKKLRRSVVGR